MKIYENGSGGRKSLENAMGGIIWRRNWNFYIALGELTLDDTI